MRLDRKELAEFILTVMEGGVMQSRTHRSVAYFDGSVRHLRRYVDQLQREAGIERRLDIKRAGPTKRPKSVARKRAK